jgi:hypothetical protein
MIRRFFTRILMILLIGFCGYNWLEIQALKTEVTELRTKQAITDKKLAAPTDWKASAQEFARQIEDLQKQAQSPETRRRLTELQGEAQALRQQADDLWHKVNPQK